MNDTTYNDQSIEYPLADGYALRRATGAEFGLHYAVYRGVDVDFQGFDEMAERAAKSRSAFWIFKAARRIGGVIMKPNYIEGLFLEPPCVDRDEALRVLVPLLRSWSHPAKDIDTSEIVWQESDAYQRAGFRYKHGMRKMIRPTESFPVEWEEEHELRSAGTEHAEEMADLFFETFRGGAGIHGRYTAQDYLKKIQGHLARQTTPHRASVAVVDRASTRMIAACLASMWPEERRCSIGWLAVCPDHRGRGIGARLVRRALSIAREDHQISFMTTYVQLGNPAEGFYWRLGFMPGPEQNSVYIPAGTW